MKILVTGGAGYIGSHMVKYLLSLGHQVVVLDNLALGHRQAVPVEVPLEIVDLLNKNALEETLEKYELDAVIHFAALASVGESVANPALYYENNVVGSYNLINAVKNRGIKKFVFSSTCSLYGNPEIVPISENESVKPINPYAKTKWMIEQMLEDFDSSFGLSYVALRYFNAAGASPDGDIGESHDPESHLIPLIIFTALNKREKIIVYGDDYPTEDGTCIRDYIHVMDLADAHIKALEYLDKGNPSTIINLGTGTGNSVLEVIEKTKAITKKHIKTEIGSRRAGDPARLVAVNTKAKELLGWQPKYSIDDIIETAYKWHVNQKY